MKIQTLMYRKPHKAIQLFITDGPASDKGTMFSKSGQCLRVLSLVSYHKIPKISPMAYILRRPFVAGDDPNKQTRNETSRGVSQQVRLGTILRVGKTRKPRKTKGDG